jgi:alpha-amylase
MASVCLYFQVHQPHRLDDYSVFDIGEHDQYFSDRKNEDASNRRLLQKVSRKSYRPATELLLELVEKHPELHVTFSFSGVVLDQLEVHDPETLSLFQELVSRDQVEVLAETYHHTLAFFYDRDEFEQQVKQHTEKIQDVFNQTPTVFRNTELAYNNEIGRWAKEFGFNGVLAEGWDDVLGWKSPNFVYQPPEADIPLLLKNYQLSDDIAFRFSREDWEGWPLTADKFSRWVSAHNGNAEVINLFMDYETFGEHQWEDTGIFEFLSHLPESVLADPDNDFKTVSQVINDYGIRDSIDVEETITWADTERDLSAWLGNQMQQNAIESLYDLKDDINQITDSASYHDTVADWRCLQTSDHFYYMCTKWSNDGDVHAYFNPYESPYDAYINYMNVLTDLRERVLAETA